MFAGTGAHWDCANGVYGLTGKPSGPFTVMQTTSTFWDCRSDTLARFGGVVPQPLIDAETGAATAKTAAATKQIRGILIGPLVASAGPV